ncbi:unnamed protein product, partial [Timema podura]|nr:unnamed protein product [Timema podura]
MAYGVALPKLFLRPARNRLNFDISLHSFVEKILINSNTKVTQGVVFKKNMHKNTVGVRKVVNVSAGAFNSPHLLDHTGRYWKLEFNPSLQTLKLVRTCLVYTVQSPIDVTVYFSAITESFDGRILLKIIKWITDEFYNSVYEPIIYKDSFSALETLLRTLSRGFIEGKNNYPYTHPMIYPNYQSHPLDVKILVEAFNISEKLSQTKTLKDIGVQ